MERSSWTLVPAAASARASSPSRHRAGRAPLSAGCCRSRRRPAPDGSDSAWPRRLLLLLLERRLWNAHVARHRQPCRTRGSLGGRRLPFPLSRLHLGHPWRRQLRCLIQPASVTMSGFGSTGAGVECGGRRFSFWPVAGARGAAETMAASWRCSRQWTVDVDSVEGAEEERLVAAACVESRAGWGCSGYSASTAQLWAWRMVEHDRPSRFPAQAAIFAAYFGWMARRGADDALTGGFRRAQGSGLGWGRYQLAAVKDAHTTGLDGRGSKDDVRHQKAQTADSRQQTADSRHNESSSLKDTGWPTVAGTADRRFVERASSRICGKSCPALSFNASVPALKPSPAICAPSNRVKLGGALNTWRGSPPKQQHTCCATSSALLHTAHASCSPACTLSASLSPQGAQGPRAAASGPCAAKSIAIHD